MKKVIYFFASICGAGIILIYSSCRNTVESATYPIINAGADKAIILPTSSVILSGGIIINGSPYIFSDCKWSLVAATSDTAGVVIDNPSSLQTNVKGLIRPGEYIFHLECFFTGSLGNGRYGFLSGVRIRVLSAEPLANIFMIGTNTFTVQSVEDSLHSWDNKYLRASAFRNGTDSGSITFSFKVAPSKPRTEFKVVSSFNSDIFDDEIKISVVLTRGSDGIAYNSIGTDNAKAIVSVFNNGKISIKLPEAMVKRVLENETIQVSADIHEQ